MRTWVHRTVLVVAGIASLAMPGVAYGQFGDAPDSRRAFSSRATLEAEAERAEREGRPLEAAKLRHRLEEGDFREGDRILFAMRVMPPGLSDTLVVRAGKVLQLPAMDDFPLRGVLRAELAPRLSAHIGRYLRDTSLRVMPLVRLTITGNVRSSGFYYVPADIPLSDILMRAGGPGSDADLGRIKISREGKVILQGKAARIALVDGLSADRLHLEAGDEISVGNRRRFPWQIIASTALAASGTIIALVSRANNGKTAEPTCP